MIRSLAAPDSARDLVEVYKSWPRSDRETPEGKARVERTAGLLRRLSRTEEYLWPRLGKDWLEQLALQSDDPPACGELAELREYLQRWQAAVLLPIDQLLLTIAQDLFHEPADLALAHKLAGLLDQAARDHPDWDLGQLGGELVAIARNERKLLGFSEEDSGFDPDRHRGKVVVATMHKAKGLEWDRVYLTSVNNYDFPAGLADDTYISEKWFVSGRRNLQAEALAQLKAVLAGDPQGWNDHPGRCCPPGAAGIRRRTPSPAVCRDHPRAQGADHHLEHRPRKPA